MPVQQVKAVVVVAPCMSEIPLSIIVPVRNESSRCIPLLCQLQPLRNAGCEVIVVDGQSNDDTVSCTLSLADRVIDSDVGRAKQMNAGAALAKGKWFWFLHADSSLPRDILAWLDHLKQLEQGWGFFPVRLSGNRWPFRVIERCICWRSRWTRVATGDQGLFFSRDLFQAAGGFGNLPLMEDIAISKRMRKRCKPLVVDFLLETSSRRWQQHGIVKTVLLMWGLRLAYFIGVPPRHLAKVYYGA